MRSAALIALLPLLAGIATAAPSPAIRDVRPMRKSLSFGPSHSHATYETLELSPLSEVALSDYVEPTEVARRFIADKVGGDDRFYIRPDVSSLPDSVSRTDQ